MGCRRFLFTKLQCDLSVPKCARCNRQNLDCRTSKAKSKKQNRSRSSSRHLDDHRESGSGSGGVEDSQGSGKLSTPNHFHRRLSMPCLDQILSGKMMKTLSHPSLFPCPTRTVCRLFLYKSRISGRLCKIPSSRMFRNGTMSIPVVLWMVFTKALGAFWIPSLQTYRLFHLQRHQCHKTS